jgi:hypothetical protein
MGLFVGLLTLPLAPVRGVMWIAEQIRQEAEREYRDPTRIQAALRNLETLRASGAIDEEEAAQLEDELVRRLMENG